MSWEYGFVLLGLAFLVGAILVLGGQTADGMSLGWPSYVRIPFAGILACAGAWSIGLGLRQLWRERNMPALVLVGGVLLYIAIAALSNF